MAEPTSWNLIQKIKINNINDIIENIERYKI